MAIAGGPDIITDGLVFGYDTGYGIANNSTATRFYKGQPSTNNTITAGYTWWGDGSNQSFANKGYVTVTDDSLKYNGYDTRLWTPGSSNNVYLNGSGDISTSDVSTVWTFSCYIKRDDGAPITSLNVYMYYPNSDGSSLGTIVSIGNGWYRVSRTRTGSSSYIGLAGFTGFPSSHKYYLSGVMLTKTNQTVPYIPVQSSRSSTQSLIDLKKSTNIDLSNVSFDSTGQPVFDGTDDKIQTTYSPQFGDFTVSIVFKDNGTASWGRMVDKGYTTGFFISSYFASIGSGYVGCGIIEPNAPHGVALQYDTSKWHFFSSVRSGTTQTIYLDGISNTATRTVSNALLNSTSIAIGSWSGENTSQRYTGELPVVLIHDKALSATEVEQTFNAYKNRFTI